MELLKLSGRNNLVFVLQKSDLMRFHEQLSHNTVLKSMNILKKTIITAAVLFFSIRAFAPVTNSLPVYSTSGINPFKKLIYAIGMVETRLDTLSYNPVEQAVGYFQIRPIRLEDYNIRTGSNYTMKDLYNYEISEKIFLYYASRVGPYNFERIARNWNGSGPKTIYYWNRVRKFL
jgi:hypothetical protein